MTHAGEQPSEPTTRSNRCLSLTRRVIIDGLSADPIHRIDQVTNEVPNSPAHIPTEYSVSAPYTFTSLAPPSYHNCPGWSVFTDCHPEGSLTIGIYPHRRISKDKCGLCRRQLITFDMVPDDVLLEIFDFYVHEDMDDSWKQSIEEWIRLAHVCRRWRSVVFQSPLRLDMQLFCTSKTPTRNILDIWPPLPLIIRDFDNYHDFEPFVEDNIIAALEHNDRVRQIRLINAELGYFTNSAAIRKPFPELTALFLSRNIDNWEKGPERMLPDSFLGGSAPRLRSLYLANLSFPGLPKLLLSTTHLVNLHLISIPRSGYIPPEVLATSLSASATLEYLRLRLDYPPLHPAIEARRPPFPPLTRSILQRLTKIEFKGTSEYLEVILARIDAPRLDSFDITFFNQLIFDTPQLYQFINRRPTLKAPEKGHIVFYSTHINIRFPSQISDCDVLDIEIRCRVSEWQLSSMEQICTSSLPPVSTLEYLYIYENRYDGPDWQGDVENTLWLDFLRPFVAVKNLYISENFVPRIAPTLQELVGERTTEVLPALDNIFLEEGLRQSGPLQKCIDKFVAARLLTSHLVAVSRWERARDDR